MIDETVAVKVNKIIFTMHEIDAVAVIALGEQAGSARRFSAAGQYRLALLYADVGIKLRLPDNVLLPIGPYHYYRIYVCGASQPEVQAMIYSRFKAPHRHLFLV